MKRLLYLPGLLLLSMVSSFSVWNIGIGNPFRTRSSIPQHNPLSSIQTSRLSTKLLSSNTDDNFDERLRKAYEEWSLTYGDTIDESRMEIFSYHFMMSENYFKETGNRIKLNEYADLTAVEFQRLKEMGGMIQDVGGSGEANPNNPHWAPEDAAQMDFFAKQASQRRQFQDTALQQQPEIPEPPPGYFSVLPTPEAGDVNAGGMGAMNDGMGPVAPGFNNGIGGGIPAAENNPGFGMGMGGLGTRPANGGGAEGDPSVEGVSTFRDPYEQRFTQSYLDSLNVQANDELIDQTPRPDQPPPETPNQNNMYNYGVGSNENVNAQDQNKYKQPDSFPPENAADKPELQDLINSRYDGIGFLEDSAMVDNSGMDYKFFPALSKMYNLDYTDPQEQQNLQDMPPPPPQEMPGQPMEDGFIPPPPPGQPSPEERRETFMNAMSALYSQMFNEDGRPPDADAFDMMQNFMKQAAGGAPPPGAGGSPPGQFGVPPQPGTFGGGGAPAGKWSAPGPRPQDTDEDLFGDSGVMMSPPEQEEEVGTEIYLGEMSYKMTRGRVIEWLKNIGDEVERGEPLCVVESDTFMLVDGQKYAESHDVVAQEDGVLAAIYTEVSETVPVGSVLGVVAADIAEASLVPQTLSQEKMDFIEPGGAGSSRRRSEPEQVFLDENGYPVDEEGYLLDSVEVDEDGYPIYDYVDGYPVDEDGFFIEDYEVDADGYPIEYEYDENGYGYEEGGYEEGGYEEEPTPDDGFGAESMYTGPVDDDPDLPSWVLGDAPSIAPAKVASKYPVIPKMNRPAPPPPPPKKVAPRRSPKRNVPKGGRRPAPKRPRGRIDDVRSPARKKRAEKPKIDGTELTLNELSYGMTKGTIIEWIKNAGDEVKKGEPLAVVEGDTFMVIDGQKYAESHDVEATQDGILAATYAGIKETLEVGAVLGIIADNEMAARNVPQQNPFASGAIAGDGPDKPPSLTQKAVAQAIQASADPEHRARASADTGFIDSVEQMAEDMMSDMEKSGSPQNDEFAKRFMTAEEKENADFAAAGAYGGGGAGAYGGGGGEQYSNSALDDPDLPSWVRGDAPSLAPAKVASKFPVIPKMGQQGGGNSPSMNAINKAREATMNQESQTYDNIQPPPSRSAPSPRGSAGPPKRRGPPPKKRRGAPPKRRGERPSGRGRIDDIRAPLNQPEEDKGTEIVLSELSYGMKKGMIIEWLKNVGDPVKKGDPIAVVESDTFMVIDTQKYAESHDILATEDGILAAQYGGPKELFDVGAVLGMIASDEAQMKNMRQPPPPSQADANGYSNNYAAASSFVPEETNEPGETYYPPPDPTDSAAAGGDNYLDDPDLPSWVRGDAPSIAPAKVASKFPVIPNMRRGVPPPPTPNPPRTPPAPVNGGTQRRIPKGRYDDTRARPKQIRVDDRHKPTKPRGRIDDIHAPLDSGGGSSYVGGSTYSAPEPTESNSHFFPDLSTPESPKTDKATPKASREETRFMPDLSSTLKPKKKKSPKKKDPPRKPPSSPPVVDGKKDTEDKPPEPAVEEPVEETVVAEEEEIISQSAAEEVVDEELLESEMESTELVAEDATGAVEENLVEAANEEPEQEDVQYTIVEEGEEVVFEGDAELETDEETGASDEREASEVEETDELNEDLVSELETDEETVANASDEIEANEVEETNELKEDLVSVIANGGNEITVEEEVAEEEIVMEENKGIEDSDVNVTAKVDIRDLKKEKTTPAEEPANFDGFDFQEATTNTTEAMVQEILVTAKARTAAEAAKIDLTAIQGTGEAGCITLDDVKLAIARKKPKIGIRFLTDKPKGRPNKKDK